MSITTYSGLKTSIADWLNRDDLTSVIPDFIFLAEHQMERSVRHYKMVERSTGDIDSQYSAVPADWLETIRFSITSGNTHRLEMTSLDDLIYRREENNNVVGRPKYFAYIGSSLEVYPTPDTTYTTELVYYQKIPALSASQTSNWLLEEAPDAYLYGSLLQAAPYLGDDERIQVWSNLYGIAVQSLNSSSERTKNSTSALRMKVTPY
jgi:hypothetical protein